MAIDRQQLLDWPFEDVVQSYTARDSMLYGLSLGLGMDPVDPQQLQFVLEPGLRAFPTMALVLGHPGPWTAHPDLGIDRKRIVHGEQRIDWLGELPVAGTVRGRTRVVDVIDKGVDKGALILTERTLSMADGSAPIASITGTTVCRGDGGFGGPSAPASGASAPPHPMPERAPDLSIELPTTPQAALLYRLNGDYNPLHADPVRAREAGFPRPISHGLLSFGLCARALLQGCCDMDPARLRGLSGRFAAPTYPGESLRVDLWRDGQGVSFRAIEPTRGVQVVSNGRALLR